MPPKVQFNILIRSQELLGVSGAEAGKHALTQPEAQAPVKEDFTIQSAIAL